MDKTLDFIAGMLNQAVGRKGCGYLKDECYDIIDSNRFLWEKLFGIGFFTERENPMYGKDWEKHTNNAWLLPRMCSWFDACNKPDEEEYYKQHAPLALQMFSFGIYSGAVINGLDIEPILDPNLYDEKNYEAYMEEQNRIAAEHEGK